MFGKRMLTKPRPAAPRAQDRQPIKPPSKPSGGNPIAQSIARQAQAQRQANRIAVRTAAADRRAGANQTRALARAERESAAALAALDQGNDVQTQFIQDEEMLRRQGAAMGRRSSYTFGRPLSSMLGGGSTQLG